MLFTAGRIELSRDVAPRGVASFAFAITAPNKPGAYTFQWRMVQEYVEWFGGVSAPVRITVADPTTSVPR